MYFRFPFFKEKNLDTFKKNSRKKNKCNLDRNLVPDSFESVWADKCQQVNANLMVGGNTEHGLASRVLIYECMRARGAALHTNSFDKFYSH